MCDGALSVSCVNQLVLYVLFYYRSEFLFGFTSRTRILPTLSPVRYYCYTIHELVAHTNQRKGTRFSGHTFCSCRRRCFRAYILLKCAGMSFKLVFLPLAPVNGEQSCWVISA